MFKPNSEAVPESVLSVDILDIVICVAIWNKFKGLDYFIHLHCLFKWNKIFKRDGSLLNTQVDCSIGKILEICSKDLECYHLAKQRTQY